MHFITDDTIQAFQAELKNNEKSKATIQKYGEAVRRLGLWLAGRELTKQEIINYRDQLLNERKARTVNGNLSAIHAYLDYNQLQAIKTNFVKVQHQPFLEENRELTQAEYKRLLSAALAKGNQRLYLLMMTLGGTGIRISELIYITVEAAKAGRVQIHMKGKYRTILLQNRLCQKLLRYAEKRNITSGIIFRTKNDLPMDRANICHDMKKLCEDANVKESKVFPHNFRHLFARAFYAVEKNLAHLADVLGHSSIETTRIYVAASISTHQRILSKMKLVE